MSDTNQREMGAQETAWRAEFKTEPYWADKPTAQACIAGLAMQADALTSENDTLKALLRQTIEGPMDYQWCVRRTHALRGTKPSDSDINLGMKLTKEELDRLIEPEPYDDWHERTCDTSSGPPGPFPCDCKTSEGWRVFLLPPDEQKEKVMDEVIEIGPECFADGDLAVINYKGENYYKACGEFVTNLQGGGHTSCVKRINHVSVLHEDHKGNMRARISNASNSTT